MSARDDSPPVASAATLASAQAHLAAVGFMASLIGHQARNRLASLRAVLELLREGGERHLTQEHREAVLRQLDEFIGDFNFGLEMARCDFGREEDFSADEVAMEALESFRPLAGEIRLKADYRAGFGIARTDRRLLRLVLLNLLRNAGEAVRGRSEGEITLRTACSDQCLTWEVADNGPGVPPALYERIFREPVTTKEESAGLGLTLCRDAMTVMGGSIAYLTPRGAAGACFGLVIPRTKPQAS
jgi:signal transduction histidine kinase